MNIPESVKSISVSELANEKSKPGCCLLDVREPWEYQLAHIKNCSHIPMHQVPDQLEELPKDTKIFVICHHGGRSMQVAQYLARHGYKQVYNVTGGIHAWSCEIDSSIPTY